MIGLRPVELEPEPRFVSSPACASSPSRKTSRNSSPVSLLTPLPTLTPQLVSLSLCPKLCLAIMSASAWPPHITAPKHTQQVAPYLQLKLLSLLYLPRVAIDQEAFGSIYLGHHGISEHVQHCLLGAQENTERS